MLTVADSALFNERVKMLPSFFHCC
jgi:hypothetical protein